MSGRDRSASEVAAALDPYRARLAEDAADFTHSLLALAAANAKGTAGFNEPSPQDAVALHALTHWRRDAHHALKRVEAISAKGPARGLATKWLKALVAALDLQRQALSLIDPAAAADAARRASSAVSRINRLEVRLDRELG